MTSKKHLNYNFNSNHLKQMEGERVVDQMWFEIQNFCKNNKVSEQKAKLYIQGFIHAVGRAVTIDRRHLSNKDSWAISVDYVFSYISRFRGKEPKNKKGIRTTNGRLESHLMNTFLKRIDGYSFNGGEGLCKETVDLHPLLWEAIKLDNHLPHKTKNWKEELLVEGVKGISWIKKSESGSIPLYGCTSVDTLSINNGNILNVERSQQNVSENIVYGLLQKAPVKWINKCLGRLDTMERCANKLKTELKRKGRIIHVNRMREYLHLLAQNDGYYIDFYRKTSCGRYFGMGMTLQSFSSTILDTLFRGFAYEIDQSTAHPTIIRDMAADFGIINSDVNDYIENKEDIINQISKEAKMRKKTIKMRCVLSSCNGYIHKKNVNRHPKLKKICEGFYSILSDLQKLLGTETYQMIWNEEVRRTEEIVDACGGADNILCWRHDGVIMKELPTKKLSFKTKIITM